MCYHCTSSVLYKDTGLCKACYIEKMRKECASIGCRNITSNGTCGFCRGVKSEELKNLLQRKIEAKEEELKILLRKKIEATTPKKAEVEVTTPKKDTAVDPNIIARLITQHMTKPPKK